MPPQPRPQSEPTRGTAFPKLEGIPGRVQAVLERKGQVILYGPPGTGKTYWAERTCFELAAQSLAGRSFDQLPEGDRLRISGGSASAGHVRMVSFHPAYGYEDFIEGYRPELHDGRMNFAIRDGIFKQLCKDAEASPDQQFFLIVDEINRGDIPRIFGELLTVLEQDKRGKSVILPLSRSPFRVPKNVNVIGTMNTADRSIALLDTALRRRFGFIELMPDSSLLEGTVISDIPIGAWLDALNTSIREHVGRDARNLQIGHSFLMDGGQPIRDASRLFRIVRDEIIPLLEEYCYEDFEALHSILGSGLVDLGNRSIRHDLFREPVGPELVQAMLAPFPNILTTRRAVEGQEKAEEVVEDEEETGAES